MEVRETAGAATEGVLRLAVAASATPHRRRTNQEFCGWSKWTHASTASRSTPPAALSICDEGSIPLPILPPGAPPLGGGQMLAHTPCPEYGPHRHNPLKSRRTKVFGVCFRSVDTPRQTPPPKTLRASFLRPLRVSRRRQRRKESGRACSMGGRSLSDQPSYFVPARNWPSVGINATSIDPARTEPGPPGR